MTYKTTESYFPLCELPNTNASKQLSNNRIERLCLFIQIN